MNAHASQRPLPLRSGARLLTVLAAALLVLAAGCGQFNDDPNPAGLSVAYTFSGGAVTADSDPLTAETQGVTVNGGDVVETLVIGAIVITHRSSPYQPGDDPTDAEREALEKDAEQSLQFLEIVDLPTPGNVVEFTIPPDSAGPWQLVGVGMRRNIDTLDEVTDSDPIYYGFIGRFLNGTVLPGDLLPDVLTLEPACTLEPSLNGCGP